MNVKVSFLGFIASSVFLSSFFITSSVFLSSDFISSAVFLSSNSLSFLFKASTSSKSLSFSQKFGLLSIASILALVLEISALIVAKL
ncbi:MAG: hypothetical protein Q8S84_02415 [bacterium]|nr:hypothetical protein [bacterium]